MNKLCKSFYVDDLITGAEDEEQAYQLFINFKTMLKDGCFQVHLEFPIITDQSQSENVTVHPPDGSVLTMETYSSSTLGPGQRMQLGEQKVLGVRWNVSSDQIVVNLDEIASTARVLEPTKRNVISLVG